MDVREIIDQQQLDHFAGSLKRSQFLQSWRWGEFQHSLPCRVVRLGIFDGAKMIGAAQLIEHTLPLGKKYWYCPRGPVVDDQLPVAVHQQAQEQLLREIASRAEQENVMFLKLEPPIESGSRHIMKALLAPYQTQPTPATQPADTWYLDLRHSDDELLEAMHPKTRYNIRLAERKGVTIRPATKPGDFDEFWRLMQRTAERDQFQQHSRAYYRQMFRLFGQSDFLTLFIAEYQHTVIAANFVVRFGDTSTYLHGASANEHREVMAPHLLQWRQILDAKRRGSRYYDFWGVAPSTASPEHRWSGITRFKQGFGGYGVSYVGSYELIFDPVWYRIYKLAQRVKMR